METQTVVLKNGQVLTVRLAQTEDAEAVVRHVRTVSGESDNFSFGAGEFEGTVEDLQDDIQAALEKRNALFLVALIGGELVGLISFDGGKQARKEHVGDFGLSVRQAHWGQGIGRQLMQALIAWAKQSGIVRKINLKVRANNAPAIALYERVGFVHEGKQTRDLFVDGMFVDTCCMGIAIDPAEKRGEA